MDVSHPSVASGGGEGEEEGEGLQMWWCRADVGVCVGGKILITRYNGLMMSQ